MAIARSLAAAGRTVVTVLHDLSLAAAWADRIAVLSRGELVAAGPPAEVLTAELIGEVYGLAVHILTDTPDGRPVVVPKRTFF
jgi:iron complex transport system ATP-binding protein